MYEDEKINAYIRFCFVFSLGFGFSQSLGFGFSQSLGFGFAFLHKLGVGFGQGYIKH